MNLKTSQSLLAAATILAVSALSDRVMAATPILANPDQYQIELFADFSSLNPPLDAFQMTITNGEHDFPAGMYVTSGPAQGTLGDRLVRVDAQGTITVVKEGIRNSETLIFARGAYGDGMLISEPFDQRIRRLLPDGTLTTFADNASTPPFGSSTFAYSSNGVLYATDGASGELSNGSRDIVQINPDGTTEVFTSIPESLFPQCPQCAIQVHSALLPASINDAGQWQEGGGFVSGTFSVPVPGNPPLGIDALFAITSEGAVTKLADGLNAIQLIELEPGDAFGSDLYVAEFGSFPVDEATRGNGAVFTLAPDGTLTEFLTNINAVDVTFDTEGVLGGGMFVTEGTNFNGPGRIWRITPTAVSTPAVSTPEPSTMLGVGVALGLRILQAKNTRKRKER
jgi:hypothetical protein